MRPTKKLLLIPLAALAAGCEDPALSGDGPGRLVDFTAEVQSGEPPERPEFTIVATDGRLVVESAFGAPDVCRSIDAKLRNLARADGDPVLTLEVEIERIGDACGAMVGRFGYEATIEAPPGTYLLQVDHRYSGPGIMEPIYEFTGRVIIP